MAIDVGTIRRVVLEEIHAAASEDQLQQGVVLDRAQRRLGINRNQRMEEALLTVWFDLFRTGHLSWGYNLNNPNPPFCHLTDQGRTTLKNLSRDPANPDGYLAHLDKVAQLNPVAASYIREALDTFNSNCFKATAVLVGAAAESVVLEVRDTVAATLKAQGSTVPKDLADWKIKRVLDALQREFEGRSPRMPVPLADAVRSNWPSFAYQIRAARNDVGHPVSVDPVTPENVHASLLIFPGLAALALDVTEWFADSQA
jgi:hypothetical protein